MGRRDRAILSVLLYHGLRREELCTLKVRDIHPRRGVLHLRVHGKGGKEAGHPDLIATANIGCYAYLRQEARVPVVHWVELLV